jgi:hypothetical protein
VKNIELREITLSRESFRESGERKEKEIERSMQPCT